MISGGPRSERKTQLSEHALSAENKCGCGITERRSTAHAAAPQHHGIGAVTLMPDKAAVLAYQTAMAQAYLMHNRGIITSDDLTRAECIFASKYGIKSGSLYREIDLINQGFRANMSSDEGGGMNADNG